MISDLKSIRIVLLNTFHPGNIGAVARAMKTMGLKELVLVSPSEYPSDEATSRAAGAADVLSQARVVETFNDAINDCTQVFATTARQKHSFGGIQKSCKQAVNWIKENSSEKVAIVFGRERTGMSAEDIAMCQQILYIPGNPEYDVLNMAAAVQIVCYQLNQVFSEKSKIIVNESDQSLSLATQQELNSFYKNLELSLQRIGYINPQQPSDTMKRLRQFFSRANPTSIDVSMMRGMIKALTRQEK